jgi:hypothetical protein
MPTTYSPIVCPDYAVLWIPLEHRACGTGFVSHHKLNAFVKMRLNNLTPSVRSGVFCVDESQWSATLTHSKYDVFIPLLSCVALLSSAQIRFVNFHDSTKRRYRAFAHGFSDAVIQGQGPPLSAKPTLANVLVMCSDDVVTSTQTLTFIHSL